MVFEEELQVPVVGDAPPAQGEGEEELDRLVAQVAQNIEQGVRVKSTKEWLGVSAGADLGLARIYHVHMQAMISEMQSEAGEAWERKQRLKLDATGVREFKVTNAAKGHTESETLKKLGKVVQGDAPWQLYTTWVGESALSAFQGFRVGARMCGAIFLRFRTRQKAQPLETFGLIREGVPDETAEEPT